MKYPWQHFHFHPIALVHVMLLFSAALSPCQATVVPSAVQSVGSSNKHGGLADVASPDGLNAHAAGGVNLQVETTTSTQSHSAVQSSPKPIKQLTQSEHNEYYIQAYKSALGREIEVRDKYIFYDVYPRRLTMEHHNAVLQVISMYMHASAMAPHRKEPHYRIAVMYHRLEDNKRCAHHALIADDLAVAAASEPWLDPDIDQVAVLKEICACAYRAGERYRGLRACKDLLEVAKGREDADAVVTWWQWWDIDYLRRRAALKKLYEVPSSTCISVGVPSSAVNTHARIAIRATWKQSPAACRFAFYIPQPSSQEERMELKQESLNNRDIVIVHTPGASTNVTYQTFEFLKTAAADPAVTHLLKLHDDSYPRMDLWKTLLTEAPNTSYTYYGFLSFVEDSVLDRLSAYAKDAAWEKNDKEKPMYARGKAGYMLTADLAREIASKGHIILKNKWLLEDMEDVSVGIWVDYIRHSQAIKVSYHHLDRVPGNGRCSGTDLTTDNVSPSRQLCFWENEGRCSPCFPRGASLYTSTSLDNFIS